MGTTEFSEFAAELTPIYMNGRSPESFAKNLFKAIYLPVDEDSPVEEVLLRTYKSYYYGQTDISRLAKKICESIDEKTFADMLYIEAEDSIDNLCKSFRSKCPGINKENYAAKIAKRFHDIISEAALPKKKSARKKETRTETDKDSKAERLELGASLVAEVMSVCPNLGCTNRGSKKTIPCFVRNAGYHSRSAAGCGDCGCT